MVDSSWRSTSRPATAELKRVFRWMPGRLPESVRRRNEGLLGHLAAPGRIKMLGYPGYLTHEHFPKAGPLIQWLHRLPRTPEHTPVEEIQQGSIFSVSTNLPRPLDSSTTRITSANRSAFIGSMDFYSCTGCCWSKSSRFDCLELPPPVLLFDFVTVHHASVNLSLPPPRTVCKLGSGDWELSLEGRVPSPGEGFKLGASPRPQPQWLATSQP